jgi:hypothetical protein
VLIISLPHLPRVTRVYRYHQQCPGNFDFFTNNCLGFGNISDPENRQFWIYQHTLEELSGFKEEPVVI